MPSTEQPPEAFWEELYGARESVWSGRVNPLLAQVAETLPAGRALDVGAGEGGDTVWLASRGWDVVALDISATALRRLEAAATDRGVAGRVHPRAVDLEHELPDGEFDLVSAQFFQSPLEFPRDRVLRDLAGLLVPGGRLLLVDHGSAPPWAWSQGEGRAFPSIDETVAGLALDASRFEIERAEAAPRLATGPDGQEAEVLDNVVLARRL